MNEQQFELHMKVLERVRCGIIDVETAVQEIKAELPSQSHNSDYAEELFKWWAVHVDRCTTPAWNEFNSIMECLNSSTNCA